MIQRLKRPRRIFVVIGSEDGNLEPYTTTPKAIARAKAYLEQRGEVAEWDRQVTDAKQQLARDLSARFEGGGISARVEVHYLL